MTKPYFIYWYLLWLLKFTKRLDLVYSLNHYSVHLGFIIWILSFKILLRRMKPFFIFYKLINTYYCRKKSLNVTFKPPKLSLGNPPKTLFLKSDKYLYRILRITAIKQITEKLVQTKFTTNKHMERINKRKYIKWKDLHIG